jgi:hypothetical protein
MPQFVYGGKGPHFEAAMRVPGEEWLNMLISVKVALGTNQNGRKLIKLQ